jgi:hypothetical protein
MITSPFLAGRDRYERTMHGWVDNTHDDAFTHTVTLSDDDHAIEVSAVCTASPGYEIRDARARILAGAADPAVTDAFGRLEGTRMVAGFTRRLAELCAARAGAGLFVDAGVELARLARQVARFPAETTAGLRPGDALGCWHLDMTGWVDLPNSCFTYGEGGRALLASRPVSTPMARELYSPPPAARKLFVRRKLSRLVMTGSKLHIFQAMHDNVHGFDLHYTLQVDPGVILAADSIVSRLPYEGICTEPQSRIATMLGQPVDGSFRKRIQGLLGGAAGCSQLYDLTADAFKLIDIPA